MDSSSTWVVPLAEAVDCDEGMIGGKTAKLAQMARAGFRVPDGFAIPAAAYERFLQQTDLATVIRMELGRKPFESMRWEEIWDTALRIRSAFLAAPVPAELEQAIHAQVERLGPDAALAVRSSAPGEDAADRSFAGLHESVVGVVGHDAILDAVRVVWASLWSDAALLYRQELALDPIQSRMAVLVQEMVDAVPSGVAFGRDPRDPRLEQAIIEAVPGPCADLVDGVVDPDHWVMDRLSGQVLDWRPGEREGEDEPQPLLNQPELGHLLHMLQQVESLFDWPPDTEWTGTGERFTLLQARPITTGGAGSGDQRAWYLSLRPGMRRLSTLAARVVEELIPKLEELGRRWAAEPIEGYDDLELVRVIRERQAAVDEWRQIYLDEFIPFAHGVRQLGLYYNDAVQPDDPYEFVRLLKGEQMMAARRNRALQGLAERVREQPALRKSLEQAADRGWEQAIDDAQSIPGGGTFVQAFEALRSGLMDVAYEGERLAEHPDLLLRVILEMARRPDAPAPRTAGDGPGEAAAHELQARFLEAVGPERREEAEEVLAIGRLSWRLRDDDNVLVGRLESQLLRALELAAERLRAAGRLQDSTNPGIAAADVLAEGLGNPKGGPVVLPPSEVEEPAWQGAANESPRQLVGQPAAPGLATGKVRRVRSAADLGRFRSGEVLVCDAIQPTMTHIVPLCSAIVERRGGMLIHGAIIARELGIPCVNGIAGAIERLEDGEMVTVDGYLGIVTVGAPEFELEGA
jgi:pyruvate,water dikinase